jgi:TRAP-type transport system periplasmic protein
MKKVALIQVVLSVIFLLTFLAPALAADKPIKWRFASHLVPGRAEYQDQETWAKRINEKSGGRLEITVYPNGALGFKPTDHLRVLKTGMVEAASIYSAYLVRDEPTFSSLLVNGAISDPSDYKKILDPMIEIKKKILDKWGIVWTGDHFAFANWIGVYSNEPIRTLDVLKGKKMRVWGKDQIEVFSRLDVAAQIVPQAELYIALKTGVIDASLYAPGAVKSISLQEVTKYASWIYPIADPFSSLAVSQKAWSKLPDDLKKIVLAEGDALLKETLDKYIPDSAYVEAYKFFEDNGGKILEPFSIKDRKKVQQVAFDVWKEMAEKAGPMAVENYKILKAALEN